MFPDRKRLPAIPTLLLLLAGLTVAGPRYTLTRIGSDGADITAIVPALLAGTDTRCLFAFTIRPEQLFSVAAYDGVGRGIACTRLDAGWSGRDYLQWYAFSARSLPATGTDQAVSIEIRPASPGYRSADLERADLVQGVLRVPLPRVLAKQAAAAPPGLPYTSGLRMEVAEDGIYQLSGRVLRDYGVPVDRIPGRTYRLFCRDREVPLHLPEAHHSTLGNDDKLLFYGIKLRKADGRLESFSETNVYWLTWGGLPGARVAVVSGARRTDPTVYTNRRVVEAVEYSDTLHLEHDNMILWLGNIDGQPADELTDGVGDAGTAIDDWYWGLAGLTELTTVTFRIPAPSVREHARIRCGFMGLSSVDSITPDHVLELFVNDQPAGKTNTAAWDGQREFIFESDTFPAGILTHGLNRLTLHSSPGRVDRTTLNWIDVEYVRGYAAEENRCIFKRDGRYLGMTVEYAVTGFTGDAVEVWDITGNRTFSGTITEKGTGKNRGTATLVFQDSGGSAVTYLVQSEELHLRPVFMELDTIPGNAELLSGAEYLVISPDSFRTELAPLLETHRTRGLSTLFVAVEDIYNRFSYGIRDPDALRRYLVALFSHSGATIPRFLLLGGDTTHDRDKKNRSRNVVPTHLSRMPGWGPGADDGYFATVAGDDRFPDLAVGRFPAQNRSEMRTIVGKTVRYIEQPDWSYWRDRMLLLGGGEPEFTRFNDEVETQTIGRRMQLVRMDADPLSSFYKDEFVAPQRIADHCNTGVYIVNFNGHGGGNIWSDNNFFGYKDLVKLHNGEWQGGGRLPVVFSFTCLTGFFESTDYRSLGEEFVRNGTDGAAAFYGASAYTSRSGNLIMNRLLLELALSGESATIGELIQSCELRMLVNYGNQYLHLVRQFNLLGDPALPWLMVPDSLEFTHTVKDSGAELAVSARKMPLRNGTAKVTLDAGYQNWGQTIVPVAKDAFSASLPLKDGLPSSMATVRAYAWNDSAALRGWLPFLKDTLAVLKVTTTPQSLRFGDSVTVTCEIPETGDGSSTQLNCFYTIADNYAPSLTFARQEMESAGDSRWSTGKPIVPEGAADAVNQRLLLYFRAIVGGVTLQSGIYAFTVGGLPDLSVKVTGGGIHWADDSLRISFEVLNRGGATAPPFTTTGFWSTSGSADTFAVIRSSDSLVSGAFRSFTAALTDTQGVLAFHLTVNSEGAFREASYDNNTAGGTGAVRYRDMRTTSHTLSLLAGRMTIGPVAAFTKTRRVFVLENTVETIPPLETSSSWVEKKDGRGIAWTCFSRPQLASKDSLSWKWDTPADRVLLSADTSLKKISFMVHDSTIDRWRYYAGIPLKSGASQSVSMKTVTGESFSVALLGDARPPDCIASVYGKEIVRPDYTAKDRPFTIIVSDPSGVLPQSVQLLLNGRRLASTAHSEVPFSGDLRSMNLSAYPEAEHRVDSLQVVCTDLAGNHAKRTFSYLPGADLTIKSFSCHPNPFTARKRPDGTIAKIRFAFLLTDIAKRATLTIYTASGKNIVSWNRSELIGYQQIEWDGRDRDGYRLANGTYYAKLTVTNDRKKTKKIIRIAKLEGF